MDKYRKEGLRILGIMTALGCLLTLVFGLDAACMVVLCVFIGYLIAGNRGMIFTMILIAIKHLLVHWPKK